MATDPDRTVEQLREASERNRTALAATVTELREHVEETATELKTMASPTHIKREIGNYVRHERENLVQSVKRNARENPLQMAAIGAAIAYPVFGLVRALPAPLLLIGAGLFLTSKRGQRLAGDAKTKVDAAIQQGSDRVSDLTTSLKSDLEQRAATVRASVEGAQAAVTSAAGTVADKARSSFHDARDMATGVVQEGAARATAAAGSASSNISDAADQARTGAANIPSRRAVVDLVKDNALLFAGVGAAVGAVIAASIPPSEAENRLFGARSEKLKAKARETAAQGIESVGDMAAEAADSVASGAAREGLDATGAQSALENIAQGVRKVADRGVDTALGNKQQSQTVEPAFTERNLP